MSAASIRPGNLRCRLVNFRAQGTLPILKRGGRTPRIVLEQTRTESWYTLVFLLVTEVMQWLYRRIDLLEELIGHYKGLVETFQKERDQLGTRLK